MREGGTGSGARGAAPADGPGDSGAAGATPEGRVKRYRVPVSGDQVAFLSLPDVLCIADVHCLLAWLTQVQLAIEHPLPEESP